MGREPPIAWGLLRLLWLLRYLRLLRRRHWFAHTYPHSYWPQTDRSHVQYSSRIRHGVSIALGMGEEIINGQRMINVNQSPCRESPLLCGIVVGRHAILPDFFAAAHTTPHMTDDAARRNGVIATISQYNLWDGTNVHRLTFMPSHTGVGRHAIIAQKSPPSHTYHCR